MLGQDILEMTAAGEAVAAGLLEQVMRFAAADGLCQSQRDALGHHQPVGEIEIVLHLLGEDLQSLDQRDRVVQGPAGDQEELSQGRPFGMPAAHGALMLLRHRREHGRDQPGRALGRRED